jgi:acyl-coenzyme A synthetase/AMP-(fatty) acid ligase
MQESFQSLFRRGGIEDAELGLRWDPAILVDEVTRSAAFLSQMRIGRGSKVIIVHSGSARFFADLFAVWTVGAAAACLDGALTSTELEIIIGFTEPAAILVDRSAPSGRFSVPILELARCRPSRVDTIFANPAPDDPALVLFTGYYRES